MSADRLERAADAAGWAWLAGLPWSDLAACLSERGRRVVEPQELLAARATWAALEGWAHGQGLAAGDWT